mmetsp:Transcript_34130/g.43586  ORF Transcript_34130/g.43586 Transcript_34130/m.43586 type:complete len:132 (+) Transcript_34130:61-456(+)
MNLFHIFLAVALLLSTSDAFVPAQTSFQQNLGVLKNIRHCGSSPNTALQASENNFIEGISDLFKRETPEEKAARKERERANAMKYAKLIMEEAKRPDSQQTFNKDDLYKVPLQGAVVVALLVGLNYFFGNQ